MIDNGTVQIHRVVTNLQTLSHISSARHNRRRRRFDAGASETCSLNNEARRRLLSSGYRRRFDHLLHILLHGIHFYRPVVRPLVLPGNLQRRGFHGHRYHLRLHLRRCRIHGSGSGPLRLHARRRRRRKPDPRDQA